MSAIRIGLVTEGPTDQLVIGELLSTFLREEGSLGRNLEFINLQPTQDRTSTTGSVGGGWEAVYKWCLSNPPSERCSAYLNAGLFDDGMDDLTCDALLIHMDSDVCDKLSPRHLNNSSTPVPNKNALPVVRGYFIRQVIENWLWPKGHTHTMDKRHVVAPAVEAIETWLVAGLSDDPDPESNHDIQKRLAELDHEVVRKQSPPNSMKRPRKTKEGYRKILEVAKPNVQRIYNRCSHFQLMIRDVLRATGNN